MASYREPGGAHAELVGKIFLEAACGKFEIEAEEVRAYTFGGRAGVAADAGVDVCQSLATAYSNSAPLFFPLLFAFSAFLLLKFASRDLNAHALARSFRPHLEHCWIYFESRHGIENTETSH